MRFTSIASRYTSYFATSLGLLLLPAVVSAATISGSGCFERTTDVWRMEMPDCTLTVAGSTSETVELTVENIDPDAVEVVAANATVVTTRHHATLDLTITLTDANATIALTPWLEQSDELWFAALSDNQARGTVETNPVFEDLLSQIEVLRPDFITNSGDLVQGSVDTSTLGDMFQSVLDSTADVSVPMYVTAGNHDYGTDLSTFRTYFGNYDYTFDYGPARFVFMSTAGSTPRGRVSGNQLTWLATKLDTDRPIISVVHHPLVVPSWGAAQCCYEYTNERNSLAEVLSGWGVDQIISGHSQGYDVRTLTNTDVSTITHALPLLVTGGAGGNLAQPGADYHFTLVHVTPDGITFEPYNLNQTELALDASDNTGKSNAPTQTVEYVGVNDLPFLRLKFKLKDSAPNYLVTDNFGNYWPTQYRTFNNYTVVYSTANVTKNTTTEFTALPATQLHTGTSQTVNAAGQVSYATTPTSTTANTYISVKPTTGDISISELAGSNGNYTWVEQRTSTQPTTYTIANVAQNRVITVSINGQVRKRLQPNTNGIATFSVGGNITTHAISVTSAVVRTPLEINVIPHNGGKAYIRAFNTTGKNIRNWYAFNQGTGVFDATSGYVTNTTNPDLFIHRTNPVSDNLEAYAFGGEKLDAVAASSLPIFLNITGDERQEVVAPLFNALYTYKWSPTKSQLVQLNHLKLPPNTTLVVVAQANQQLITVQRVNKQLLLVSYQWHSGSWQRLQRMRLPAGYSTVQLQDCICVGLKQPGLAIALSGKPNANARLYTYSYQNGYWKQKTSIALPTRELVKLVVGPLESTERETLVALDVNHQVYTIRTTKQFRLKRLPTVLNGVHRLSLQLNSADQRTYLVAASTAPGATVTTYQLGNNVYAATARFSAYGSSFPGAVSVVY